MFARHAASLLVLRHGPHGAEILMGVRASGHRFMPNALVFPGGAVDTEDAAAAVASEPSPGLMAMLERNARPRLARAIAIAAARELLEETGLSFGTPPRLDTLRYLCRAVTPPASPIRFNARFLLAPADAAQGTPGDTRELLSVRFRTLEEALAGQLMLVTREILTRLEAWLQMSAADQEGRTGLDVYKGKRWLVE